MSFPLTRKAVARIAVTVIAVAWFVWLAPTSLGGSTSYIRVSGHSMDPTYATGDVIIQRRQDGYAVGDVIAFRAERGQVIHRIVGGNGRDGYDTQGDNKDEIDPWHPTDSEVIGRSQVRLPSAGEYIDLLATPSVAGIVGGGIALLVMDTSSPRPRRRRRHRLPAGAGA